MYDEPETLGKVVRILELSGDCVENIGWINRNSSSWHAVGGRSEGNKAKSLTQARSACTA